ncbi:MAG: EF-P beta-lysylation protein EpmB, partial [Nevskiales bacterium]
MNNSAMPAVRASRADIIPKSAPRWQQAMRDAVTDMTELLRLLNLPADSFDPGEISPAFPMRVPHSYIASMQKAEPNDPLLLQVLPSLAETIQKPGFTTDPVGDLASQRGTGLLHKYAGRALLITTGACA